MVIRHQAMPTAWPGSAIWTLRIDGRGPLTAETVAAQGCATGLKTVTRTDR